MSFNLFAPPTKDDIRVGYIDPTLGYVDGVSICEANEYAKNNPGTTFIFRDGDNNIQYLSINEVNRLTPNSLVSTANDCGGIQEYKECGPPRIQFFGGDGIGAVGNPVIGRDGSLLAVDVVRGGYGYQYPPIVAAKDHCQFGNGAVLTAILGETVDQTEVFEGEEDFEEYELCPDTDVGYGTKYDINGNEIGDWDPQIYTNVTEDPIKREIELFQKALKKPFWTTRQNQPNRISVSGEDYATQETTNVTFPDWSEFLNKYGVSPVKPSDTRGSDEAGKVFTIEWEQDFPISGEYIFRGACDNESQVYIDDVLVGDLVGFKENPTPLQKTIEEGNHIIRIDLVNYPIVKTPKSSPTSNLTAKFVKEGSSFYLQVDGTGSGEISFAMDVNDSPFIAGLAAKEVRFPSDKGPVRFQRSGINIGGKATTDPTKIVSVFGLPSYKQTETIKASSTFTGGRKYGPIQIIGADQKAKGPIINNPNRLGIRDADGNDENIKIIIQKASTTSSGGIKVGEVVSPKSWNENPMGVSMIIDAPMPIVPQELPPPAVGECPPNPIWSTRFPGSEQKWYPVNYFGKEIIVEGAPATNIPSETQEVEFSVYGEGGKNVGGYSFTFTSVDGQHTFTLKGVNKSRTTRTEKIQIRKNVNYVITSRHTDNRKVEQGLIKEGTKRREGGIGESNKIFADGVKTANDNDDIQVTVKSGKFISSNKRKIGGRSTFDLTYVLEPGPGATPTSNPQTKTIIPGWSKFTNRYAISPVLPLDKPGSDLSGVVYSNSWNVILPYAGFYAVKGTSDNDGRILIDGNEVSVLEGANVNNPKLKKVFLTKGSHRITTEVSNAIVSTANVIDTKIFSTQDWRTPSTSSTSNLTAKFIQQGSSYYLQVDGTGSGEISFVMDVNDDPFIAGLAAKEIKIPSDSGKINLKRTLPQVAGIVFDITIPTRETVKKSGTFTGGRKYGPIEIIGAGVGAKGPIINNPNRLGIRDADGNDENIKITIGGVKGSSTSAPATSQSPTKNGVVYNGPELFGHIDSRWSNFMNGYSVSPKVFSSISQQDSRVIGKYTLTWTGVDFPYDGTYKFNFQADNNAVLKIGGKEILKTSEFQAEKTQYAFNLTKGKYDVVIELENIKSGKGGKNEFIFSKNPMGASLFISKDVSFEETNKTSWKDNPIGVSAILIPPPCAKKIGGKGVVEKVIVEDPGNGYLPAPEQGPGYPVTLVLDQVIVEDPGINYSCGKDQLQITPNNGAQLSYNCDAFGKINSVQVLNSGVGFDVYPEISLPSETGVNARFRPVFRVVRDPVQLIEDQKLKQETLIQVTDLVGLKQTGYVEGRAYYGAVYYDAGVPYAGYYKTAGPQTRVYATLQESITAKVTTPPSAIQRSGTDIRSNDPRLNIPGTIQDTQT